MSRQTLFAYLPDEDRAEQVVSVAASIARRDEAHLIGGFVVPPMPVYPMVGVLPQEIYQEHARRNHALAAAIEHRFGEATRGDRYVAEWRTIEAGGVPVSEALMPHVRSADLVIVPGYSGDEGRDGAREVVETVAMESGRPVLMLPRRMPSDTVGEHITVAWDGSREATRAVFDAMPLLRHASSVRLVSIGEPRKSNVDYPGAELAATLARCGVRCEADNVSPGNLSIGDALLGRVAETGSDLLVMGIYGHSKLREFVFGGMTRHILGHMTVPVLVSR